MTNVVAITCLNLQVFEKNSDKGIPISEFLVKFFLNKNCQNSRASNDVDMKLGPVNKLNKRKTATLKNLMTTSCQQIMTSPSFLQFMADLEHSRSRILHARSIYLTFSLIVTFYLTKIENRIKKF